MARLIGSLAAEPFGRCRAMLLHQLMMLLLPCNHTTVMACTCVVNPIETVISPPAQARAAISHPRAVSQIRHIFSSYTTFHAMPSITVFCLHSFLTAPAITSAPAMTALLVSRQGDKMLQA